MKRSGKWYRKNEADVMNMLGIEPTPNSGSGWVVKEDGQSENVICQLKSTDASSITVKLKDVQTLEYNAQVAHKIPVFALQFIGSNSVYILLKPQDLKDVAEYIKTGKVQKVSLDDLCSDSDTEFERVDRKTVGSSKGARDAFNREREKEMKRREDRWKRARKAMR